MKHNNVLRKHFSIVCIHSCIIIFIILSGGCLSTSVSVYESALIVTTERSLNASGNGYTFWRTPEPIESIDLDRDNLAIYITGYQGPYNLVLYFIGAEKEIESERVSLQPGKIFSGVMKPYLGIATIGYGVSSPPRGKYLVQLQSLNGTIIVERPIDISCGLCGDSYTPLNSNKPNTDIFDATRFGNVEAIDRYMQQGGDVHAQDAEFHRPLLFFAIDSNNPKVVEHILNWGAKPDYLGGWFNTPLTEATTGGKTAIMDVLIKAGANPYDKEKPALFTAALHGHLDSVKLLVEKYDVDLFFKDSTGRNALERLRDSSDFVQRPIIENYLSQRMKASTNENH